MSYDNASTPQFNWSDTNRTIKQNYTVPNGTDPAPFVTLSSPGTYKIDYDGDVTFNCSALDTDGDIVNISIYTNISGTFEQNQSMNTKVIQ